jgi:MFS family permease
MWMAWGIGAVIGGLVSGRLVKLLHARNLTWGGLVLSGALFFIFSRQSSLAGAMVLMFIMAIPVAALNAGISPQLMSVTPKEFTGRMIAVLTPITTAASMISVVLAGTLASTVMRNFHVALVGVHLGRIDTIFSVSAILIFAAGVYAYFSLPPVEQPTPPSESTAKAAAAATD